MTEESVAGKLAAILYADVAGYSRLRPIAFETRVDGSCTMPGTPCSPASKVSSPQPIVPLAFSTPSVLSNNSAT